MTTGPVHPPWPARLHVVTGKGGTGKTTVAAALALALAAGGHRTLLVEVEGRQGIAQLFGTDPLPYEERTDRHAPRTAARSARWRSTRSRRCWSTWTGSTGSAPPAGRCAGSARSTSPPPSRPGLRDVLLTGKVKEATTRTVDGRRVYHAVVLDAPPAGRIGRFLNVTAETARLAKVGPIKTQSEGVAALLRSPMTAVHLVTLLEEMPVQETADALAELRRLGLPVGRIIVNAARPPLLTQAARPDPGRAAPEPGRRRAARRRGTVGAARTRPRSPGCTRRPVTTWSGSGWRQPCGRSWPSWAGRWSSCRCCPRGWTGPGWRPSPRRCGRPDRSRPGGGPARRVRAGHGRMRDGPLIARPPRRLRSGVWLATSRWTWTGSSPTPA